MDGLDMGEIFIINEIILIGAWILYRLCILQIIGN